MKILIAALLVLSLSSCAGFDRKDFATGYAMSGIALDGYSTYDAIEGSNGRCKEGNPLFKKLGPEGLVGLNVAMAAGVYYFRDYLPESSLWIIGTMKGGVGLYNFSLDC